MYNFYNVKNTHGGVIFLFKLQASACSSTKIITLPSVFFKFFKLDKWCKIAPSVINNKFSLDFSMFYEMRLENHSYFHSSISN